MAKKHDPFAEVLGIEPVDFDHTDILTDDAVYFSVWKGKHHTEESKQAIGRANRGSKRTPEAKEKMRIAKLGKKRGSHSDEHKARLAESLRRFGSHSEERRRNQSIAAKRRWQNEKANKDG